MNFVCFFPMTFCLTMYFLPSYQKVPLCLFTALFLDFLIYSFPFYHCILFLVLFLLSIYLENKQFSRMIQILFYTLLYYIYAFVFFHSFSFSFFGINLFYNLSFTWFFFSRKKIKV